MKGIRNSLLALSLVLLLAACSSNSLTDVAGTWTGELIGGSISAVVVELDQAGTTVDGTLRDDPQTVEYQLNGTVNGDTLEFVINVAGSGSLTFEGIVEGNTLEGWVVGRDTSGVVFSGAAFSLTRE